jgi:hypothetical protein
MITITTDAKVIKIVDGNDIHVFYRDQVSLRVHQNTPRIFGAGSDDGISLTLPVSFNGVAKATVTALITSLTAFLNT